MPHFDVERQIEGKQIGQRLDEIRRSIYGHWSPIEGWEAVVTGRKQGPSGPPETGWESFEMGTDWGGKDITAWFRATVSVPDEMSGKRVVALIRLGGEALIYINGEPCQGLDRNRDDVLILEKARGGEKLDILIEAYSSVSSDQKHTFGYARLALMDISIHNFYWDARVAFDVLQILPEGSATQLRMLDLINDCVKQLDISHKNDKRYTESIQKAQKMLDEGLKEFHHSYGVGKLILAGHAHIDTAWRWPLRETQRKCARTFASVLKYMEQYPYYDYSQSQPQLYEFTKKYYPAIYQEIKKRIKEGRWEPVGATWVEQDSNISSGESLVRQLLYGNRFFRKEFGIHSRTCWLPDAFGFCWSLPQILKKAGVDFFATTKISWNQYDKFPYSMFMWQGIDGTKIFSLMPPLNYNGQLVPKDCLAQWEQFKQKDICDEVLYSFGHGDGGGGPTIAMLETGSRLENMVGVPRCSFGKIQDYFYSVEENVDKEKLPIWNDELYLEMHRGCQTTQSRTKRNNRRSELLYRNAEFLASMSMLAGGRYPQDRLYEGWKVILCSQFHDILPGSSINEVYKDTDRDYARVLESGNQVVSDALETLKQRINTSGKGQGIIVVNTLSWLRDDVASVKVKLSEGEGFTVLNEAGEQVPCQVVAREGEYVEILFEARNIPPLGYSVYRLVEEGNAEAQNGDMTVSSQSMENTLYRMELDEKGRLCRLYDKSANREVIPQTCRANALQFFDDRPHVYDAWDIDFNYAEGARDLARFESATVRETGPVRGTIRVVRKTEKSTIVQDISIYSTLPRIDFITNVDWWEKRTLMKVAFPLEVLSPRATYEIQFGIIERPTHFNTSWDKARFEVPAQRWVDLSEGDYGVSLMNDCKYGHDIHNNVLRLSLLRSPVDPDPHADEGEHHFTYSLHPHSGDWREGETVQRAYELNCPLITLPCESGHGDLPKSASFASVDRKHVIVDTVKKAEDSDDIILRLYEAQGQRGKVTLTFGISPEEIAECNLMEEEARPMDVAGNTVSFYIKPYEIITLKARLGTF